MQAIEFEATSHNHLIRIPDEAPDNVPMRVLLLVGDLKQTENQWKNLLSSMPDVGDDEDFVRPKDYGRDLLWDI